MNKYLYLIVFAAAVTGMTACEVPEESTDEGTHKETQMSESQSADHSGMNEDAGEQAEGAVAPDADAGITETDTNTELQKAMELGLVILDDKLGEGAEIKAGDIAVMHYTGWLFDDTKPDDKGDKFDSSRDRGTPFTVDRLGAGRVIKGWDLGVPGMKVGGRRTLIIPPELGYGERGTPGGPIPGGATLVFDVELLELK